MKKLTTLKKVLIIACGITVSMSSCKKDNVTPSSNTSDYYISFTDGGNVVKMKAEGKIIYLAIEDLNFTSNAKIFGSTSTESGITRTEFGFLKIVLPTDSSNINKVVLNKKYKAKEESFSWDSNNLYGTKGIYLPDNTIGSLSYNITFKSGTDKSENYDDVTKYYHTIKSIKYLNGEYDTIEEMRKAYYVVTGDFNISVKNDVSNKTRDLTNGTYKIIVETKAK